MGLVARDDDLPFGWVRDGDFIVPWWQSRTGIIVKWIIFLILFTLIMGYILGGYLHARARLRKGLPPLAYHRCLVGRRTAHPPPQQQYGWPQNNYGYYQPNAYHMNDMNAPPVYDPNRPPVYMPPPDGGSKVDPSQWTRRAPETNPAPDYQPSGNMR
ncbi:hypothetical protein CDD83_5338 [Cordyceps sp. RAO-2017]|nr:hypothetical protein CDD83_5338 [Cordyceps sp. RAO-2017]